MPKRVKHDKNEANDAKSLGDVQDLHDQLKRALADYQNLQRRVTEEKEAIGKFATQILLLELLPVIGNLEQVVASAPDDEKKSSWFAGLVIVLTQLHEVLKKQGVEEINPANEQFNPEQQEAVDVVEGEEEGKVVQVLQKGYTLHGRVIQVAKVKVAKKT